MYKRQGQYIGDDSKLMLNLQTVTEELGKECMGKAWVIAVSYTHLELDEMKFRRELWSHQPLTDFWLVGRGIAKKLEQNGMFTMGDVALCSERNEDLLLSLIHI